MSFIKVLLKSSWSESYLITAINGEVSSSPPEKTCFTICFVFQRSWEFCFPMKLSVGDEDSKFKIQRMFSPICQEDEVSIDCIDCKIVKPGRGKFLKLNLSFYQRTSQKDWIWNKNSFFFNFSNLWKSVRGSEKKPITWLFERFRCWEL